MATPRFARTVGVAPGTLTMQLTGISPREFYPAASSLVPTAPCPPEEMRWMAYDRGASTPDGGGVNGLMAAGVRARSHGRRGLFDADPQAPIDPTRAHVRWDIIGVIGGGALVISLMTGLIASAFSKLR